MNKLLENELLRDEEIIWSGQPDSTIVFSMVDAYLVPFSILWGGFVIYWLVMAIISGAPFFFCLFGIPLVLMGLYFVFGRFIYKRMKKKHTFYAITNQRVLILCNIFNKSLQAEFIKQIPCINKSVRSDGIGKIKFGNSSFFRDIYGNTGLEIFQGLYGKDVPVFYDIKDANMVYKIVNEVRKGKCS